MARAEVASASARSDSIQGLAQSIAKPAYRRLLTAEPVLRRAVPVLIIAFLVTICVGAVVQVLDHRRQAPARYDRDARRRRRSRRRAAANSRCATPPTRRRIHRSCSPARCRLGATAAGRRFLLTNTDGVVVAATPAADAAIGRRLIDVLGPTQPLTTFGAGAGVMEIALPDGSRTLATVRMLTAPFGQLAVVQPRDDGAGALALGHHADHHALGHHRLRRADPRLRLPLAGDARARSRPDLRDGAHPHRYRAQPRPLRPVGLGPRARPHLLVAVDVRDPRAHGQGRPADASARSARSSIRTTCSSTILRPSSPRPTRPPIDHAFRMRHANGHWVWLRARCELVRQAGEAGAAPDRHRGRHHRAEEPGREDGRRRHAAARRHRDHPGSLRGVGCREPAGAVQFEFPGTAQPARRGDRGRRLLRIRGRGRPQAGGAQQGHHRRPEYSRRAHLRGAARRRPLAAHQRAAHQGRRLRLGRHRHHRRSRRTKRS